MSSPDVQVWCREQMERLVQNDSQFTVLNEIKEVLVSLPQPEASSVVRNLDLSQIIRCLNSSDRKQVDTSSEVLRMCFIHFTVGDLIRQFAPDLRKFLTDQNVPVRLLAVTEIHRTIISDPSLLLLPEYIDIILAVVPCIGDAELNVATKAMEIISHIDVITFPRVLQEIKLVLEGNSSARCNGYDVIVTIASKSPDHLEKCIQEGYIQSFVQELKTKDILYQLAILELMSKFAMSTHGLNYLINQNIFKELTDFISTLEGNSLGNILIPGLIKFFGSIAHVYPRQITEQFPSIMKALFEGIHSGEITILMVSLDTLGFIAITSEGKLSLGALGHILPSTIKVIGTYIKNSPTELRIRSLNCLAHLVAVETDPALRRDGPIDHRVTLMTREWFRTISDHPSTMDVLVSLCKNPFPDLKLAAMGVLDAICQHQWGEELVARTPGFLEFLLDRYIDHTKESKLVKWEIIRRLSKSASFEANIIMKMKTYVDLGPYYVEPTVEVATEGE